MATDNHVPRGDAAGPPSPIITGRGIYVPDDVLTNGDVAAVADPRRLAAWVAANKWCQSRIAAGSEGTAPALGECRRNRLLFEEYIGERVGIESRRVVDRGAILERQPSRRALFGSDLGAQAARAALDDAGLEAGEIDLVICGTSTPDCIYPSTAIEIQDRLGARSACAFDVLAACSSFVFALETARALILAGCYRRALVVAAEYFSCGVDYGDPFNSFFWGDAAAAAVVEAAELGRAKGGYEVLATRCRSQLSHNILTGLGGTRPFLEASANGHCAQPAPGGPGYRYFYQNGPRVYREVIPLVDGEIRGLLVENDLAVEQVRLFMLHQASMQMIEGIKKRLFHAEPEPGRVPVNLRTYGNTSSCGVAICLAEEAVMQPGDVACMAAFGGGYTVGTALIRKVGARPREIARREP